MTGVVAWGSVCSALAAVFQGVDGYAAPTTSTVGVPVFDGLPVTGAQMDRFVLVGADPSGDTAGSFQREQTAMGGSSALGRYTEAGTIRCFCVAQTGDPDVSSVRSIALGMLDDLYSAVQADATLGGAVPKLIDTLVSGGDIAVGQTKSGAYAEASFTVAYQVLSGV